MSSSKLSSINTSKNENYQIAISLDGKFAVTLNTATLQIKILKNTDYRPFITSKNNKNDKFQEIQNESDEVDKQVARFKIKDNFTVDKLFDNKEREEIQNESDGIIKQAGNEKKETYEWSIDISNLQKHDNDIYFIFVAVSCIDDKNKMEIDYRKNNVKKFRFPADYPIDVMPQTKKGIAIYRLKIKETKNSIPGEEKMTSKEFKDFKNFMKAEYAVDKEHDITYYCCECVSGIPRFIDSENNNDGDVLRKFIVLNLNGIYNFEYDKGEDEFILTEKFKYPKCIKSELEQGCLTSCIQKLITCIYDKYLLAEHYKNGMQALEVYDLVEMKLVTSARRIENKNKRLRKYNKNTFSVSKQKLQFCFTQGLHSVNLYFIENGLEISGKSFHEMLDKIHSLEFIDSDEKLLIIGEENGKPKVLIWDMYNSGEVEQILLKEPFTAIDFHTHLTRTSGNILQVDVKGNVTSLRKIVEKSREKNENELKFNNLEKEQKERSGSEGQHIYYFGKYKNFIPIVDKEPWIAGNYERISEPWITGDYEKNSFGLYEDGNETLQLVVGRSSVQIWHQFKSDPDGKGNPPNEGEPFLDFIWTNGIPVYQENQENRLRIKNIKFEKKDFYLEVYWYEYVTKNKNDKKENMKMMKDIEESMELRKNIEERMGMMKDIERMVIKERSIKWQDINENWNGVRYACKALAHLNKRRKKLINYFIKHCYEEMVMYINRIIWRFINHKPDEYKLLDVRYNIMKSLILGDCDHLIKFILFGNEENDDKKREDKFTVKHMPRSIIWKKWKNDKSFVQDDDLDHFESNDNKLKDKRKQKITNDLELAIYHCKGHELKDTIIVAYLLEYYSRHAKESAGWLCTISKALPLLYKYHYDDYTRKLFRKECFADQDYFSAQDPFDIIPEKYQLSHNRDKTFMAFRPNDKLQSNRVSKFKKWTQQIIDTAQIKIIELFKTHHQKPPIALRVVPLAKFTIHNFRQNKPKYDFWKILTNVLWFIFIPRWYKIGKSDNHLLSPFARVIRYENNDDMYDNPATEAVIDFFGKKQEDFLCFFIFDL